jgi:hypothetical protein
MADARSFRLQIEDWLTKEVPARAVALQKDIVAETLTTIVNQTPVGNNTKWAANKLRALKGKDPLPKGYVGGQAKRNWQVTIGTPSRTILAGVDPLGTAAQNDGYAVIGRITQPSAVWIANPLPYMQRLENGGPGGSGWSKQAPTGMVANAVAAVSAKYARVR